MTSSVPSPRGARSKVTMWWFSGMSGWPLSGLKWVNCKSLFGFELHDFALVFEALALPLTAVGDRAAHAPVCIDLRAEERLPQLPGISDHRPDRGRVGIDGAAG